MVWSLLIVASANVLVFWSLASAAGAGRISLGEVVVFAQAAAGASAIAFGSLSWALYGAPAPVTAVLRLQGAMAAGGALREGHRAATSMPAREIRFRDVTFAYPGGAPVLEHFDLTIPAGSSIAIVGERRGKDHARQALCRLYDLVGRHRIDGVDLRPRGEILAHA